MILWFQCENMMSAEGLERQTRSYLSNEVPQIQQHGGNFEIRDVD